MRDLKFKNNLKKKMELWVEIQRYQSATRQTILKNIPKLTEVKEDTQRILKSDDFLRVLLSSIYSLEQFCDITFNFFLKIFNTICINKNGEIDFEQVNLFFYILKKNSQKIFKSVENCKLLCDIFSVLKGDLKENCSPRMIKEVNVWLQKVARRLEEAGMAEERFKISCLILKFLKFEISEGTEFEEIVYDRLSMVISEFKMEIGFYGLEKEIRYWIEKLWLLYMRRDDIVEAIAQNCDFMLGFDFDKIYQKVKGFFLTFFHRRISLIEF